MRDAKRQKPKKEKNRETFHVFVLKRQKDLCLFVEIIVNKDLLRNLFNLIKLLICTMKKNAL